MAQAIWEVTVRNHDPAPIGKAGAITGSASGAFAQARALLKGTTIKDKDWVCTVNAEEVTYNEFIEIANKIDQNAEFIAVAPGEIARIESHYKSAGELN
jgi:hypothetical protein